MSLLAKAEIAAINFYRKYLSQLKRYSHCKYTPTCSEYASRQSESTVRLRVVCWQRGAF